MKPWLARTLLWSAIALALSAALWLLLDSKWSGEVERLRARPSASVEELLPPIDPADDAGPIYVEVGKAWESWQKLEHGAPPRHVEVVGIEELRPEERPQLDDPHPEYLDSPEFAHIEELMHAAAERPHCRLWNHEKGSFEPGVMPGLAVLTQSFLLPAARQGDVPLAWTRLESVLGLAGHLREDPLIITLLLSRAISKLTLETLRDLLARLPLDSAAATRLLAQVRRLETEKDVLRALDGERALFAEPAWDCILEGRFPSGIWMDSGLADSLSLRILRPWRLLDEAKYFEIEEALRARLAADPWRAEAPQEVSDVFPITRILCSGFQQLTGAWILEERRSRDLAEIALRLAIARAESGSYPSTLDALGDVPREPLTDEPYAYARAGEGYQLSSWSIPR